MTKLEIQTYRYNQQGDDQGDEEQLHPSPTTRRHCALIALTIWRKRHTTPAHVSKPSLINGFSRN